jgi:hypothetical protein
MGSIQFIDPIPWLLWRGFPRPIEQFTLSSEGASQHSVNFALSSEGASQHSGKFALCPGGLPDYCFIFRPGEFVNRYIGVELEI